jgi:hypothetical protein
MAAPSSIPESGIFLTKGKKLEEAVYGRHCALYLIEIYPAHVWGFVFSNEIPKESLTKSFVVPVARPNTVGLPILIII